MRTSEGWTRRAVALSGAAALLTPLDAQAATRRVQFWATHSGGETLDAADGTGNPYATLLIYLMAVSTHPLPRFAADLRDRTVEMTAGAMTPETAPAIIDTRWGLNPTPNREKRVALVLTFSDYSASDDAPSLPGAAQDSERVSRAFSNADFTVTRAHDPTRAQLPGILAAFARASSRADVAAIYSTGHGVEVDGVQYVLHRDHRIGDGVAGLARAARWEDIARSARGKRLNLTFWAGCRNNPFA
jgi:hypothetical protein